MNLVLRIAAAFAVALSAAAALAEPGLESCADQLPDGTVHSAPARLGTPPAEPAPGNVHLCKRSGATAFFALEYDPERLGPIWVAYRLSDTFGADRCASVPRRHMRCFFQAHDAAACVASDQNPTDPFHVEGVLVELGLPRLGVNPLPAPSTTAGTWHRTTPSAGIYAVRTRPSAWPTWRRSAIT